MRHSSENPIPLKKNAWLFFFFLDRLHSGVLGAKAFPEIARNESFALQDFPSVYMTMNFKLFLSIVKL